MITGEPRLAGQVVSAGIYAFVSVAGLAVVLSPLWRPLSGETGASDAYGALAPLVLAVVVGLCFAALALEAASSGLGARTVAALGVLVAINTILRFLEVAIPGPGGFSPVFFLIILTGYAFGARFGLLMGAMTMGVSAVLTGGVGPWLPYQMLVAGWVGLSAGWLPRSGARIEATIGVGRGEIAMLAAFGGMWGFLYGLLMTPWLWLMFDAEMGPAKGLIRFMLFYGATSLVWDGLRAAGTVVLMLVAGRPVLRALRRVAVRLEVRAGGTDGQAAPPASTQVAPGQAWQPPIARPTVRRASSNRQATVTSATVAAVPADAAVHPYAWVAWAAAVAALASLTRNPLVLSLACLAVLAVRAALPGGSGRDKAVPVARLAVAIIGFSALYHLVSLHLGETVLLRLPPSWPLVGGPLTLEALALGLATGLSLVTLLLAFTTLHVALSMRSLVKLVPRAFGSLALVGAVALTYVPSLRHQAGAIREAQAVRGLETAGLRSWLPMALPLLVGALERSAQLAESMASRGLTSSPGAPLAGRLAFLAGLVCVLVGWLGAATGTVSSTWSALLVVAGVIASGGVLVWLGRRVPHSTYRHVPTRATDALVAGFAWLPLVLAAAYPAAAVTLTHSPLPVLALPPLDPWLALTIAGLAAPAVLVTWSPKSASTVRAPDDTAAPDSDTVAPGGSPPATHVDADGSPGRVAARLAVPTADVAFRSYGVRYPHSAEPAVNNVSLDMRHGHLTLLAGPSGSGKSTLLRSINGLVPHFTGGEVWGDVTIGGRGIPDPASSDTMPAVGFVAGDPETSFVMDVVADEVAFALEHLAVPRSEMEWRVTAALECVGLRGFEDRPIRGLSGGERQRVAVAAALALEPRVLLLDEPTSQLDDACAAEVLAAVADIASRLALTVVLVEHRLDRVLPVADQLVYLPDAGSEPLCGPPEAVLSHLALPEAPAPPTLDRGEPVLELLDLSIAFDARSVLDGASLTLHAGEVVALTGPSGSGKTTLLRLATGLLRPERGSVQLGGVSTAGRSVADVCRSVGYLPQDPSSLLFADSVADEVSESLADHDQPDAATAAMLSALGIGELADRYPRDLSTGQRQRAALAAVTVTDPPVLLLDEPTRGMDDAAIASLAGILHERAAEGRGVLVATHDRRLTQAAHRILRLERGRITEGRTDGS